MTSNRPGHCVLLLNLMPSIRNLKGTAKKGLMTRDPAVHKAQLFLDVDEYIYIFITCNVVALSQTSFLVSILNRNVKHSLEQGALI